MGFEFVNDQFDFPAFMVTADEFQGRGLHGIQQGGEQAMHLRRIGRRTVARAGLLVEFLSQAGMQTVLDDAHGDRGLSLG